MRIAVQLRCCESSLTREDEHWLASMFACCVLLVAVAWQVIGGVDQWQAIASLSRDAPKARYSTGRDMDRSCGVSAPSYCPNRGFCCFVCSGRAADMKREKKQRQGNIPTLGTQHTAHSTRHTADSRQQAGSLMGCPNPWIRRDGQKRTSTQHPSLDSATSTGAHCSCSCSFFPAGTQASHRSWLPIAVSSACAIPLSQQWWGPGRG